MRGVFPSLSFFYTLDGYRLIFTQSQILCLSNSSLAITFSLSCQILNKPRVNKLRFDTEKQLRNFNFLSNFGGCSSSLSCRLTVKISYNKLQLKFDFKLEKAYNINRESIIQIKI